MKKKIFKILRNYILKIKLEFNKFQSITGSRKRLKYGLNFYLSNKSKIYLDGLSLKIGNNCNIHDFAVIRLYGGSVSIGNNVSINPFTIIYGHGGVVIGDNTRIASHVTIIPANHKFESLEVPIYMQGETSKGITIGNDVWIATGVKILDGVQIGNGCIIGAGSIINKSIDDYAIVVGNPGKVIKFRK